MTNKEYIQNCSEEELIKELVAYINEVDLCTICEKAYWNMVDCFEECPTAEVIVANFLEAERIVDDNA